MADGLAKVREDGGRLFILGVGGGAGHASHAVNDFRKLCGMESYTPTDNVSELTARTNDDGWDTSYTEWLAVSRFSARDALLVFSVGGGSREHGVSVNLVNAIERGRELGSSIYGVVGAPGGSLAALADVAVVVDAPAELKTPLVESLQAVVWHGLVSHPTSPCVRDTGSRWPPVPPRERSPRGFRRSRRRHQRAGSGSGERFAGVASARRGRGLGGRRSSRARLSGRGGVAASRDFKPAGGGQGKCERGSAPCGAIAGAGPAERARRAPRRLSPVPASSAGNGAGADHGLRLPQAGAGHAAGGRARAGGGSRALARRAC